MKSKGRIFLVDDDELIVSMLSRMLKSGGYEIRAATGVDGIVGKIKSWFPDIVLLDINLPERNGIDILEEIVELEVPPQVIMLTADDTAETAVKAMKLGAVDYLTKPFNVDEVKIVLRNIMEKGKLKEEVTYLRKVNSELFDREIIGESGAIRELKSMIEKIAKASVSSILITGESGTGKELVARAIHAYGPWCDLPFVPVDCGALSSTLIESELFGHVRGAFTGASQNRSGLLVAGGKGTVFLDEIAELPVELQSKLLRAIQEREVRPVGSNQRMPLEARIIAGTNQHLEGAITRGTFRKDLFFRLNVVSIKIPPLRERKSDIPALVRFFLERHQGEEGRGAEVSSEAMVRLMNYNWPGNVRELENCMQRALVLGAGPVIQTKDLPSNVLYQVGPPTDGPEISPLEEMERRAILQALRAAGGDRLRAAKLLGIGKTTIYRKLKEYRLKDEDLARPA